MRLVRSGNGPIFRSTAPEWLEQLILRTALLARIKTREDEIAITFADRLREAALTGRLRATFTHIPHEVGGGGKNAVLRYTLANALGLVAGSADYVFIWKGGGCWIEIKVPTTQRSAFGPRKVGGALSTKQKLFRQWCETLEAPYHLATSSADALAVLQAYGVYDPERRSG